MTDRLLAVAMIAATLSVSYPLCMRAAPTSNSAVLAVAAVVGVAGAVGAPWPWCWACAAVAAAQRTSALRKVWMLFMDGIPNK